MNTFQIGELVTYEELYDGYCICVVLAAGCSYGSDSKVIYVIYSLKHRGTYLVYDTDIQKIKLI